MCVDPRENGYSRKWNLLISVCICRKGSYSILHCEEFAGWHNHVVTKPASDDGIVHNWLVRLVLEVAIPARSEFWARPLVHHSELFLCGADLDASFDTVSGKRSCAIKVPLIENLLLDLRITTDKIVEGFDVWLGSVCCKREIVVLEVKTDTRKIDQRLYTSLAELLWVTDTGSLKDERRAESASRNDDLLPGLDDPGSQLSRRKRLSRNNLDSDGTVTFEYYLFNLVVHHQVQVLVNGTSAVNVAMSGVRSSSGVTVDPLEPVLSSMAGNQVLKIIGSGDSLGFGGPQEVLLDWVGVVAKRNLDRTLKAVEIAVVARTLVCLVLLHERDKLLGGPAFGLKVIVVRSRGTSVHL